MALVRTVLRPNLVNGIRNYDPVFKPTVKQHKSVLLNFTSDKIYKELLETVDKPPRMHSFFIPKYKQIRRWQAEASIDVGLPAYKRFPVGRTLYRVFWFMTIANMFYADYKLYLLIMFANYGMQPPPFVW